MDELTPAAPDATSPALQLQLRLRLQRASPGRHWTAELTLPGSSGQLSFPDLDALARYLSRLDAPPRGLR